MGTVSSQAGAEEMGSLSNIPQNLRKMELKIDFTKEVHPCLRQLLYQSLSEIRQVYEKFQRRMKGTLAFVDKTIFCKIVPFTRTNSLFIFENFSKNHKYLSVYEFLCVLVITAYTHYINKIHFLYILFDLDCNGGISLNELLIIFKSIIMGYCKLTESPIPSYTNLEKFAKLMFLKSDIQADNQLELKEIIEWVESNTKAMELFARFEPLYKIKENFEVFTHFQKYSEEDACEILKQINKSNKDDQFFTDIGKVLGARYGKSYLSSTQSVTNAQLQNQQQQQQIQQQSLPKLPSQQQIIRRENVEEEMDLDIIDKVLDNHARKYEGSKDSNSVDEKKKEIIQPTNQQQKLPKLINKVDLKNSDLFKSHVSKNIIIIKGNTLTRQEVFKLKDYFDRLSDKQNQITIKEFTKSFQDKPHMKRVTASLFNYLDDNQSGQVSFEELLVKLYPSLTPENFKLINQWIRQYTKTYNAEQKQLIMENNQDKVVKRKRVLPRNTMYRIKQIFDLLDEEKKGYLTLQNLKNKYTYGFSQKELEELFQQHDQDKDGKLMVEDFVRIILPPDYVIEEKEEQASN